MFKLIYRKILINYINISIKKKWVIQQMKKQIPKIWKPIIQKKNKKSMEYQELKLENYKNIEQCKHKEYRLVDYYIDNEYSCTNFDRSEFQRMLEDIKNKKIDVTMIQILEMLL